MIMHIFLLILAVAIAWWTLVSVLCFRMTKRLWPGMLLTFTIASLPVLALEAYKGPSTNSMKALGSFALLGSVPTVVVAVLFGVVRHDRRIADTIPCPNCNYDLTGNVSGVCPECRKPNDAQTK